MGGTLSLLGISAIMVSPARWPVKAGQGSGDNRISTVGPLEAVRSYARADPEAVGGPERQSIVPGGLFACQGERRNTL